MLVELSALRARVGQPQNQTEHDVLLTDLEAESVQWVETRTGRPIAFVEDVAELINGLGDEGPIRLPYEVTKPKADAGDPPTLPHQITSADIEVRLRERIGEAFDDALDPSAYEIRWDRLRNTHLLTLVNGDLFPHGRDTVQVTYAGAGWGLGELEPRPRADLTGLVLGLVSKRFQERSLINATGDREAGAWELSPFEKGVIERYTHAYGRGRSSSRVVPR